MTSNIRFITYTRIIRPFNVDHIIDNGINQAMPVIIYATNKCERLDSIILSAPLILTHDSVPLSVVQFHSKHPDQDNLKALLGKDQNRKAETLKTSSAISSSDTKSSGKKASKHCQALRKSHLSVTPPCHQTSVGVSWVSRSVPVCSKSTVLVSVVSAAVRGIVSVYVLQHHIGSR